MYTAPTGRLRRRNDGKLSYEKLFQRPRFRRLGTSRHDDLSFLLEIS